MWFQILRYKAEQSNRWKLLSDSGTDNFLRIREDQEQNELSRKGPVILSAEAR